MNDNVLSSGCWPCFGAENLEIESSLLSEAFYCGVDISP